MKRLLQVILFFVISVTSAQADIKNDEALAAAKEADGSQWVKLDDSQKNGFLEGFLAGSFFIIKEAYAQTRGYSEEKLAGMVMRMELEKENPVFTGADLTLWTDMEKDYLTNKRNQALMNYMVRGIPKEKLIRGLDALYADAANLNIPIADAVYFARMSIINARQDELDCVLQYLREGKKFPGRLTIENEKGDLVKTIKFP